MSEEKSRAEIEQEVEEIMERNGIPDTDWHLYTGYEVAINYQYTSKKVKDDLGNFFKKLKQEQPQFFEG